MIHELNNFYEEVQVLKICILNKKIKITEDTFLFTIRSPCTSGKGIEEESHRRKGKGRRC